MVYYDVYKCKKAMIKIKDFFNTVRLAWISLISNIKSFFSSNNNKCSNESSDDLLEEQRVNEDSNVGKTHNDASNLENEQERWYDALEELESDEEYFDAVENFDEQQSAEVDDIETVTELKIKEYEKNKYYSLQDGLQEKTELDNTSQTLALAFEITPGSCSADLSNLKLLAINKVDHGYALFLEDDKKNLMTLHSQYLNMYFPPYFEKHSEKKTYAELFSPKENGIINDIIIPLQVPKEVSILTEKFRVNRIKAKIKSCIPDCPEDIYLENYKDHVNFYLNSDNIISLSITSTPAKIAACASGTPFKTEWPIKDILVSGDFANTINKHIREQHEEEKVNSSFKDIGNITQVRTSQICQG